ncbi:MAG: hypothetical protein ACREBC_38640, partial [Pyrinomonadaceae bacterium]
KLWYSKSMGRRRKWKNLTDEERANDLWFSVQEHSYFKDESRSALIEYLKTEARIAKQLSSEVRRQIYPLEVPIAQNNATGVNIAYSMLQPLAVCRWINEQDDPVLYRIFRSVAVLLCNPRSEELWQELFNLIDSLEDVSGSLISGKSGQKQHDHYDGRGGGTRRDKYTGYGS